MAAKKQDNYGLTTWWKRQVLKQMLVYDVPIISIADALAQKETTLFIDSRAAEEYAVSHLAKAVYAGYEDFDLAKLADISKEESIIVYCSIGVRSERIGRRLIAAGYTNVKNLYGGIFEWVNAELEIVDDTDLPTTNIHPYNKTFGAWLREGTKAYGKK